MVPIRVVVAQTHQDSFADTIAEAIRGDPHLTLCNDRVVSALESEELVGVANHPPAAVVLIGAEREIDACSLALLRKDTALVVLRIGISSDVAHLDFRRVPLIRLMDTLRDFSSHHGASLDDRLARYALLPGAGLVKLQRSPASGLEKACAWLDAIIRDHLARRERSDEDVPGFRMTHATIRRAVAAERIPAPPESSDDVATAESTLDHFLGAAPRNEPLALLAHGFGLSRIELRTLLVCLAPDLDPRYQSVYGYLQDDMSRRHASLGLVCELLGEPVQVRCALACTSGLARWRLLGAGSDLRVGADEPLKVDPAVVAWLCGAGTALLDARVARIARSEPWPGSELLVRRADVEMAQRLAGLVSRPGERGEWLVLSGTDSARWRAIVEVAATTAGLALLRILPSTLAGITVPEADDIAASVARAAQLMGAIVALDLAPSETPADEPADLKRFVQALRPLGRRCIVIAPEPARAIVIAGDLPCHVLGRAAPDAAERERLFSAAADNRGLRLKPTDASCLAGLYTSFSVDSVTAAASLAKAYAAGDTSPRRAFEAFARACRRVASPQLPQLARQLEPCFELQQVVLPADRRAQLDEMVAHVVHARAVLETWGFGAQLPYGRGIAALFSGPSGTGKTMAAQAIARELRADLYVVDLARIISKYIGETEKNLDSVFADAERAGAMLLFDEADALFGKRSEVKDAHDRYANIEVAYLLQRMEAFAGLAILTTNMRQNLDGAFLRRLRFVVEFPKPDVAAREKIWTQCLPSTAPRSSDVDLRFLAKRLELTGGNIRQVTLRAAFAAARESSPVIAMRHIVEATRAELVKLGMPSAERAIAEHDFAQRRPDERAA